ncbi:hypothetical protein DFH29DRAFT_969586 [Suillus ampliporus]|nr:hypothetical protein DFH29DRAFT_969586 [Suillus ampliporus]
MDSEQSDAPDCPLPNWLMLIIFDHIDTPSLLSCKQVCRLFNELISAEARFIYKIELLAEGLQDCSNSSLPVDRLALLRKYQAGWKTLSFTQLQSTPYSSHPFLSGPSTEGYRWWFNGGVLFQAVFRENALAFSCIQMPSTIRGIPEKRWDLDITCLTSTAQDWVHDPSQGLLVLVELVPTRGCIVHALDLTTGHRHPLACSQQLVHDPLGQTVRYSVSTHIFGHRIGVLLRDKSSRRLDLLIWDWTTGARELVSKPEYPVILDFAFITEDLLLLTNLVTQRTAQIQVISCAKLKKAFGYAQLKGMDFLLGLQIPPSFHGISEFFIRMDPDLNWNAPHSNTVPFCIAQADRLFMFTLRFIPSQTRDEDEDDEKDDFSLLFVPLSTILKQLKRAGSQNQFKVPWSEWGPSGTRMRGLYSNKAWERTVYGMKYLEIRRSGDFGEEIEILDFNQYTANRDIPASEGDMWHVLEKESLVVLPGTVKDEVITSLPVRKATPYLPLHRRPLTHAVAGEDGILLGSYYEKMWYYMYL